MKSKSELNMEIEKLEKELLQTKEHNKLVTTLLLERNTQIDEAKKKADYYEAHYNVNYEIWLKQTKQIVDANKILDELDKEMRPKNYNVAYLRLREVLK